MVTWAGTGPTRKQGTFFYFPLHPYIHLHPSTSPLHPPTSIYIPLRPSTSIYIPLYPPTSIYIIYSSFYIPSTYSYILLHPPTSIYIPLHPPTSIYIHLHPSTSDLHPPTSIYIPLRPRTSMWSLYILLHQSTPLTGRTKKNVTVLEFFNDRLFKFSGVVPDIVRCLVSILHTLEMRKFRKLYKLYEYMPTLDVFVSGGRNDMMTFYSAIKTRIHCPSFATLVLIFRRLVTKWH